VTTRTNPSFAELRDQVCRTAEPEQEVVQGSGASTDMGGERHAPSTQASPIRVSGNRVTTLPGNAGSPAFVAAAPMPSAARRDSVGDPSEP
jgi:hypothetical protein